MQQEIVLPDEKMRERTVKFTDSEWLLLNRAAEICHRSRHAFNRETLLDRANQIMNSHADDPRGDSRQTVG